MVDQDAAAELRASSAAFVLAIEGHTAAVLAAGEGSDDEGRAYEELSAAQHAYFHTAFRLTHGEDEDDEDDEPLEGEVISVVQRHDYLLTDPDAVMAAGRAAYLEVWPDDGEDEARADVTHLGRALYQLAHAHGWDDLAADGLEILGGIVGVLTPDEPLGEEPEEWLELVAGEGDTLFSQVDVYG